MCGCVVFENGEKISIFKVWTGPKSFFTKKAAISIDLRALKLKFVFVDLVTRWISL